MRVKNKSESAIHIHLGEQQFEIPPAKYVDGPEKTRVLELGVADIDDASLAKAQAHYVASHYFTTCLTVEQPKPKLKS